MGEEEGLYFGLMYRYIYIYANAFNLQVDLYVIHVVDPLRCNRDTNLNFLSIVLSLASFYITDVFGFFIIILKMHVVREDANV